MKNNYIVFQNQPFPKLALLVLLILTTLTGCKTGPIKQNYWYNPNILQIDQPNRFTLDSTECSALANQYIPEPQTSMSAYQSGNIRLNTPNGPVYGTYNSIPLPPTDRPIGVQAGIEQAQRQQNRKNYAVACMRERGWILGERTVSSY